MVPEVAGSIPVSHPERSEGSEGSEGGGSSEGRWLSPRAVGKGLGP